MKKFAFAVIGAGPAGIAVIGKLIDHGVPANHIAWIDPYFQAGDFGRLWSNVSSNTKVELFLRFFHASAAFRYQDNQENFSLGSLHPEQTCELYHAAEPLLWVTERLRQQVSCFQESAQMIQARGDAWEVTLAQTKMLANKVVLATGAEPVTLSHQNISTIPLTQALDKNLLQSACDESDVVAVFGSSHSAVMAMWNLLERPVKKVINFYRSPLRYAIYMNDWVLFDDTGLKGKTADWAKQHIDAELHHKLERYVSDVDNVGKYLSQCNKAVYAVGFKPRQTLMAVGVDMGNYNNRTGEIAPKLFGAGIAYPEAHIDRAGNVELRVGLWKFMDYLSRVIPQWIDA